MPFEKFSPPVLFLVFNRPELTRRVFQEIRRAAPQRLYVACDGPRGDVPADAAKVDEVRKIASAVDWDCAVKTLFRQRNMGCKMAVSSAIDWFFENEEEGIILEDDCLPDQSFFPFCTELLEKYRGDERVMMISGDNFQQGGGNSPYSYYFSKYCHIWGWASWRRAWKHYDVTMRHWPRLYADGFLKTLDVRERWYWRWCFEQVYVGRLDTWDYQWTLACWANRGLAAMPAVNLVSNIGFSGEGTHTKSMDHRFANLAVQRMSFPMVHTDQMVGNPQAETLSRDIFFTMPALKYYWRNFKGRMGIK